MKTELINGCGIVYEARLREIDGIKFVAFYRDYEFYTIFKKECLPSNKDLLEYFSSIPEHQPTLTVYTLKSVVDFLIEEGCDLSSLTVNTNDSTATYDGKTYEITRFYCPINEIVDIINGRHSL